MVGLAFFLCFFCVDSAKGISVANIVVVVATRERMAHAIVLHLCEDTEQEREREESGHYNICRPQVL